MTPEEIELFQRDGAICLRGMFSDWVAPLQKGLAENMADPGPHGEESIGQISAGSFYNDYCNWPRIAEYEDFVRNSPAAELAATAMQSKKAQIFHEHVLVKEPGTSKATPWHHDLPYYCVQGQQTVSIWLPLDPVPKEVSLIFVSGSHRWGKLFYPRYFKDGSHYPYEGPGFEPVPDIDAAPNDYEFLCWALEPGDAVLFNFKTLHGTAGNPLKNRRRAFATRWLGDDVTYQSRPGRTSPPFPGLVQKDGDKPSEDWFPVLWPRS